jgi:cellulose synthase (UDP-forming)
LPNSPTDVQKAQTADPNILVFSFLGLLLLIFHFVFLINTFLLDIETYIYLVYTAVTIFPVTLSLILGIFLKKYDLEKHNKFLKDINLKNKNIGVSVDIFITTCGEDIEYLKNTFNYVSQTLNYYKNSRYIVKAYVLDDTKNIELANFIKEISNQFNLNYVRRPDVGKGKKGGNLNYAKNITNGEYILVLDADFAIRKDFIEETIPYFEQDLKLGILQTAHMFTASNNIITNGSSIAIEAFNRLGQRVRDMLGVAICCGSAAVHRRSTLEQGWMEIPGEDVNTGLTVIDLGYYIKYLPICYSMGVSASDLNSYFNQQYRWTMSGNKLIFSDNLWKNKTYTVFNKVIFSFLNSFYILQSVSVFIFPVIAIRGAFVKDDNILIHLFSLITLYASYFVIFLWTNRKIKLDILCAGTGFIYCYIISVKDFFLKKDIVWEATGAVIDKSKSFKEYISLMTWFPFLIMVVLCLITICTQQIASPVYFLQSLINLALAWYLIYKDAKDSQSKLS